MIKICETCNKSFEKPYNCSKKSWGKVRFCSRKCKQIWMKTITGDKIWNYKGGFISKAGYKIICHNGQRMYEHRYIMENHLSRKLHQNESVHHKDGDKLNNNINNLTILTKSKHGKMHYPSGSLFGSNSNKSTLLTKEQKRERNNIIHKRWKEQNIEKYREYQKNYQRKIRKLKKLN